MKTLYLLKAELKSHSSSDHILLHTKNLEENLKKGEKKDMLMSHVDLIKREIENNISETELHSINSAFPISYRLKANGTNNERMKEFVKFADDLRLRSVTLLEIIGDFTNADNLAQIDLALEDIEYTLDNLHEILAEVAQVKKN